MPRSKAGPVWTVLVALAAQGACGQRDAAPAGPAPPPAASSVTAPAPSTAEEVGAASGRLQLRPRSDEPGKGLIRHVAWDASGQTIATTCGSDCPPGAADGGGVALWSGRDLRA